MSLNPDVFEKIDKKNPVRLIRAIEVEISELPSPTPLPYLEDVEFKFVGLTGSREFLYSRVDAWLGAIWENGLIEETKKLISSGFENTRPLNGLVYKSVKAFIAEELSEEEAKEQIKGTLHAYIRRQQTYFKKNKDIKWFDIENSTFAEQIEDHVQSK
jgi:tRNA dimethylallyltransferase